MYIYIHYIYISMYTSICYSQRAGIDQPQRRQWYQHPLVINRTWRRNFAFPLPQQPWFKLSDLSKIQAAHHLRSKRCRLAHTLAPSNGEGFRSFRENPWILRLPHDFSWGSPSNSSEIQKMVSDLDHVGCHVHFRIPVLMLSKMSGGHITEEMWDVRSRSKL